MSLTPESWIQQQRQRSQKRHEVHETSFDRLGKRGVSVFFVVHLL